MYVAGSHTVKDWWDDITKIPVWGDLGGSTRYKNAVEAYERNPQVNTLVGHSLGGSVILYMQKNFKDNSLTTRTFGAQVSNPAGHEDPKITRYRNWLDPVSVFDRGAQESVKWNPCT